MKLTLALLVLPLGLLAPTLASAQELGSKGDAVFSVDRLMGISGTHVAGERMPGHVQYHDDWTTISFGWRASPDLSPFDMPRFAFDYLVIEHLSIGGSLGYVSLDANDAPDVSMFEISPRIGYLYSFGRVVGIWPRGGFTYHSASVNNGLEESGLALTLECPFTFSPASHFAFHVGPTFDIDMFGSRDPRNNNEDKGDRTYRTFGLSAGLLGWL
jgi:hypothetical protein